MNEYNIIVSGVGGQGVLFLTGIIAKTALRLKKNFIQSVCLGLGLSKMVISIVKSVSGADIASSGALI